MKFKFKTIINYLSIACFPFASLDANPLGHVVTNGSATFSQQGSSLNITNSPGTIIDWQKFSVQKDETTRFIQQSVDSAVLNRVVGQDPSQILGKLQSNGRVFIINPNGILFGANSIVDVGGLVASTLNLSNENFISQQLNFSGNGRNGSVNNQGEITTPDGGFIYLIAPNVENHGVITSPKGEVILAAGHSVQLVSSENPDLRVTLTAPEGEALNVGDIITRGGKTSIYAGIIIHKGTVSADSAVVGENGNIFFKSTKQTTLSSTSVTSANGIDGGSVIIKSTEDLTEVSGNVSAKGKNGKGGEVLILGEHVGLLGDANIDASGYTGGGTVLIGGSWQNSDTSIQQATKTIVESGTTIKANAIDNGDGGTIVAWSDVNNHTSTTFAHGAFEVKGGRFSGNGGRIETSGGYLNIAGINVNATSINGHGGEWLLDPYDITIDGTGPTTTGATPLPTYESVLTSVILNTDIEAQLNAGTNVTIQTGAASAGLGNITVNAPISKTSGGVNTLTLKAHNNIITNSSISVSGGSAMHLVLTADQESNGVGAITLNSWLSTNGDITLNAPNNITLNDLAAPSINTIGNVTLTTGEMITRATASSTIDILGNVVTLNAATGINNAGGTSIYLDATSISFSNSSSGLVRLYNNHAGASSITGSHAGTGNVIIESSDTANPFTVAGLSTNNGYISLSTGTINITGAVNAGSNSVYLKNYSAGAIVGAGTANVFDLTTAEFANITAGNIFVGEDALGSFAGVAQIASSNAVDFGGKNVWFRAQNGITFSANNITNNGGELYADNMTTGDITTGSGVITADKVQFRSIGNVGIGSGGINSTAVGGVYLLGADINIGGSINAGTNNVYLSPYLPNTAISIGGSQAFDITQADINNVLTSDLWIGSPDGSTAYAGIVDVASVSAINAGARKFYIFGTDNVTVGANNLAATGGLLYFDNYTSGKTFTSGTGSLSANDIIIASNGAVNIGSGGLTSTGYSLLKGTDVNIGGTINAGAGDVYLLPYSTGVAMSIGGVQTFDLTQTDLTNITANVIHIGENQFSVVYAGQVDIATSAAVNLGTRNINVLGAGNITLGNNTFSVGGLNINSSAGGSITTGAGTIITNGMSINSAGDLTIGTGGLSSSAAGINLSAANNIFQNGNIDITSSNFINLFTAGGTINMGSTSVTSTNGGNITYSANGNIALGRLYTGATVGDVSVTSTTGSITDVGTVSPDNIFASTATLSAATGIGTSGFNVYFNNLATTNLVASTSSGGIDVNSKSAMNVGAINAGSSNFILTSTAPGSYITTTSNISGAGGSINSSDNLTIGAGGITSAGNLSLIAAGTLSQSGNVTTTAGGSILLQANAAFLNTITSAGNIGIDTNQISITNAINAGTNGVYITPRTNNPISIDGSEVFDLTQGEINNITAGNLLIGANDVGTTRATTASISTAASTTIGGTNTFVQALNNITFGVNNFTSTGTEMNFKSNTGSVTTGSGLINANILVLEGPGTVTVGTGGITTTNYAGVNGGDVSINGTITSPIFYFSVFTPGSAISIGGGQPFNIVQSDIDNLNVTTTYIGNNPYVANTNNVNMATALPIDFGARNVVIQSDNGMLFGANAFKATGGNFTFNSANAGFDITTGAGNIAASNLTFSSTRDIIIGTGGINAAGTISLNAINGIFQNGNLISSGAGSILLNTANQNITMATGTNTTSGNGNISYNSGGNITLAMLDSGTANTTLAASGDILDSNGNGVNNVNANNLTVSSGGNTSLDYQITGTLASAGVVGTADLRVYSGTTTTTTSSTNEPITTTLDTISDTTNSLSTDTSLSNTTTTTSTAPLADTTTAAEGTVDSTSPEETSIVSSETTTSATTEEVKEEESKEETETQVASTDKPKKQSKQSAAKKLPICK